MSVTEAAASLRELAEQSNAWPFEEARKIVARLKRKPKDEVIFETGYGPSGLPHIGTFGEVARTTMVRHAFRVLTDDKIKTRLIAFSDDMDGLRKVPDNVPNKEMLAQHLGKPLTKVPDPFGTHPVVRRAQQRAAARLPRHVRLRIRIHVVDAVLHVRPVRRDAAQGAGALRRGDGDHAAVAARGAGADLFAVPADRSAHRHRAAGAGARRTTPRPAPSPTKSPDTRQAVTTPVTGGRCKLQWKPDWAMRWVALGIDYEMAGKDLIDSVKLSGEICRRSAARRRKASTTSCSWTRRARKSPSPRATA